jgi:hypothetical protein
MHEQSGMNVTIRDQLHRLVDELHDLDGDSAKPTLHANIDKFPDRELTDNLDRLQRFRRLFDNRQN